VACTLRDSFRKYILTGSFLKASVPQNGMSTGNSTHAGESLCSRSFAAPGGTQEMAKLTQKCSDVEVGSGNMGRFFASAKLSAGVQAFWWSVNTSPTLYLTTARTLAKGKQDQLRPGLAYVYFEDESGGARRHSFARDPAASASIEGPKRANGRHLNDRHVDGQLKP
jgi:hypothetical protein